MLSFTGRLKVFVALEPCDMRRGHDGLLALVGEKLKEDIRSGALFVFTNKSRRLLKVLYWDGTGVWLLCKRLEPERSADRPPQAARREKAQPESKGDILMAAQRRVRRGKIEAHARSLRHAHRRHRPARRSPPPVV